MTVTLASLLPQTTQATALQALLGLLQLGNFPVTAWQTGSVPQTLVNAQAQNYSDAMNVVAAIAAGGYLDYATGDWLTLLAHNVYQIDRKISVFAQGVGVLTDTAAAGPFTIQPLQLTATSTNGLTFTNATGGTLPQGGTLSLTWQASSAGAVYNIANGALGPLLTTLPGVTITNPSPQPGTLPPPSWLTQTGTDAESDLSLATRCRARWPGLGGGATGLVYQGWALTASAEVTKVRVFESTPQSGQVSIYLAGAAGAVSTGAVTAVTNYIQPLRPLCVLVNVASAVQLNTAITATLTVRAAYKSSALATALANLITLQNGMNIGDTLYLSAVIDQLMNVPGAVNAVVSAPAVDVVPLNTQIVTLIPNITIVAI